jgi:hypothetical protein
MLSITVGILVGGIITIAILTLGEVLAESGCNGDKKTGG